MYDDIFGQTGQNADESIFELQFRNSNVTNRGLDQMYYRYNNASANGYGYLKASSKFGSVDATGNGVWHNSVDQRLYEFVYDATSASVEQFGVRKFVATTSAGVNNTADSHRDTRSAVYQNWIFYRLTDVMLMKAEALTQIYRTDSVLKDLQDAFEIVKAINVRDRDDASLVIKWNTFSNPDAMEKLVLDERLRELAFEGKRWYDLMRYNYRQLEADQVVRYDLTLAEQESQGMAFAKTTNSMLDLVKRKLGDEGDAVAAKLRSEAHLYLPVSKTDIEVSRALRQNPVYSMDKEYEKNY
jgi:hypothetical protein